LGAAAGLIVLSGEDMFALLPADAETSEFIAARLKISEHTVKFHVSSILGKLRATTRGEAVARGVREGLVVI
jgi:DNA-binding NarL/FixJ family response regulator